MKDWVVLLSDVHFNVKTLALASAALRSALQEALTRNVPLVIAGDLNDTKALMRGECVNAIIQIFQEFSDVKTYALVGNHDLINEKGKAHTLNFLRPYAEVIDQYGFIERLGLYMIPYQTNTDELVTILRAIPDASTIIMHQGIMGAEMGDYHADKTSVNPSELANFRVITGHYHRAQSIKCGRPRKNGVGLASYIGTPYTVTFTEANDGPKGIQILKRDGLLTQVPLGLRKHVIVDAQASIFREADDAGADPFPVPASDDLLWVKLRGPASEVDAIKKSYLATLFGRQNFKFDRYYDESEKIDLTESVLPPDQLFDKLIDSSEETPAQREFLKKLWRSKCAS